MRPKTNPQRQRPRTGPAPRRRFPSFKFSLFLLVAAVIGGGMWLRSVMNTPYRHEASKKIITIEPGASASEIVGKLYDEGVLEHEAPMWIWLRIFPSNRKFKAGEYEFKSPISPREIITQLVRGSVATRQFTIPEGFNQFDISRLLYWLSLKVPPPDKK